MLEQQDNTLPSIIEALRPPGKRISEIGVTTFQLLFEPTLLMVRPSEIKKLETKPEIASKPTESEKIKEIFSNFDFAYGWGWVRTITTATLALITNDPIIESLAALYATDTALTGLRRIGWGRTRGIYNQTGKK